MHVGRLQPAVDEERHGLVHRGEDVQSRDDGGRVDEGIFEFGVAGEQLGLKIASVSHVPIECHVHAERRGDVLEGYCLEKRHVEEARVANGIKFRADHGQVLVRKYMAYSRGRNGGAVLGLFAAAAGCLPAGASRQCSYLKVLAS